MNLTNVEYNPARSWPVRIIDQAKFSLARDIGNHPRDNIGGILETAGDFGLWFIEVLPKKVLSLAKKVITDPRIVTIGLTSLALLTNSYIFYPQTTYLYTQAAVKVIVSYIPAISAETLKFSAWAFMTAMISSAGFGRALGRWMNNDLREAYYQLQSAN